ncbi:ester cyclase [Streptomyces sp. NBC_01190]|uniref:ester cyclase n=1 Tax=Streptomyces sp. NBC_01190 TaxID=2903767 RepID=UPI00386FA9FF|nr:ester cyclase [Streptomyces sp. NBC_01190]
MGELLLAMADEVGKGHRPDRLAAHYEERYREHDPRIGPGGRAGARAFWTDLLRGFPDLSLQVDLMLTDQDRVMAFLTWRGTRAGPYGGVDGDGRRLELRTSELFRLGADGRIAEHWAVVDYSVLSEFGVLPRGAAVPAALAGPTLAGPHGRTERANIEVVLGAYREVMSGHRLERADAYYARDYLNHNAQMPAVPNGVAAFKEYFAGNFAAFPDLTVSVEHLVAAGDLVMVFAVWRGHFTGVSRGRRPTGKRLEMRTSDQFRIAGGKVVEHWEVVDYSGLQNAGIPVRPLPTA